MLNALTGEEGSLQAGALPSVKAASVAGATAIHQALGDEGKLVVKPPKKKKERKNPTVGALNTSWFIIRWFNSFLGFVAPYLMVSNKMPTRSHWVWICLYVWVNVFGSCCSQAMG